MTNNIVSSHQTRSDKKPAMPKNPLQQPLFSPDSDWTPPEQLPHGIHPDPYEAYGVYPIPLVDKWEEFDVEVCLFFDWLHNGESFVGYQNRIFPKTAIPMVEAWWLWKEKMINEAVDKAREIESPDWRKACVEWLERKK